MSEKEMQIDWGEFSCFVEEFEEETDRAAVILGAAKLDTLLYQLIGKYFLAPTTGKDELLDGDSPLSTFSAKINIAYRLGLIDGPFAKALHLIRRIRNAFAHELSGSTLDSGAHRDRVKELSLPFKGLAIVKQFEEGFITERKYSGPSAEFRTVLAIMACRLDFAILRSVKIKNDKAIALISRKWPKAEETSPKTKTKQKK